jgi:hypothetical protein
VAQYGPMTAKEVLATVAAMPNEDCLEIQAGIAELLATRFSVAETTDIRNALTEAEAEFARGEGLSGDAMRRHFGLQ